MPVQELYLCNVIKHSTPIDGSGGSPAPISGETRSDSRGKRCGSWAEPLCTSTFIDTATPKRCHRFVLKGVIF